MESPASWTLVSSLSVPLHFISLFHQACRGSWDYDIVVLWSRRKFALPASGWPLAILSGPGSR